MVYSFVIQFEFLIIENCHKIDRAMIFSLNTYSTANECGRLQTVSYFKMQSELYLHMLKGKFYVIS